MRVACVQFSPTKGKTETNFDRIIELTRQAEEEGAELVVFPEACTSGYFLEGGVTSAALPVARLVKALSERHPEGTATLCVGHYELGPDAQIYNSATLLNPIVGAYEAALTHRKLFLPTYGVFDEERFVTRGHAVECVPLPDGSSASILICEDVWHSITPTIAALHGAKIILTPSASPAREFAPEGMIGNHDSYRRICRMISQEHGVFVVNAQLTGFEGGKGLVGGSIVTDPFGNVLVEGPIGEEALLIADLDFDLVPIARAQAPMLADLQTMWPRVKALVAEID